MKITRLVLKGINQFGNVDLKFTYPDGHEKAGEPLEKVCLIGRNGTGKSTILKDLIMSFNGTAEENQYPTYTQWKSIICLGVDK